MEKYILTLFFAVFPVCLSAQGLVSEDNALEAPPSSIDLLKHSIQSNTTSPSNSSAGAATVKQQAALQPVAPAESASAAEVDISPEVVSENKTPAATPIEKEIEGNNSLAKGERVGGNKPSETSKPAEQSVSQKPAASAAVAQEELDYASRLLQQAKQDQAAGRRIPPAASQGKMVPASSAKNKNRPFNPNDYRPGVEWKQTNSKNFTIYTQKREGGIGSSNMSMLFESSYDTLRRNIPWMMSDKVRIFVYQNHNSYLKHEPNAKAWTRALAYPTRGEIVVYDEPGKQQELKEVFTHELVHIFTQQFFDKHKTGRLMTPEWLDEGLAVYMEDQAYNGKKGGPWGQDLKTLNIQRSKQSQPANFSSSGFGRAKTFTAPGTKRKGKPVPFLAFDQFMQEGALASAEGQGKAEQWYLQAYAMVRFLLNPAGGVSPSNRMQFEQFTRLMSQGEQLRDPSTGFPVRGRNGKPLYQPYSAEKAMGRAYRYNSPANFEDAFWRWADIQH